MGAQLRVALVGRVSKREYLQRGEYGVKVPSQCD